MDLPPDDFKLSRLRYIHPTPDTDEQVEDKYNWKLRLGLLNRAACTPDLVDNRAAEPAVADD